NLLFKIILANISTFSRAVLRHKKGKDIMVPLGRKTAMTVENKENFFRGINASSNAANTPRFQEAYLLQLRILATIRLWLLEPSSATSRSFFTTLSFPFLSFPFFSFLFHSFYILSFPFLS